MVRKLKNIELRRFTPEAYSDAPKKNLIVLLDNVRSMLNVGSVFRTCDAFAIRKLYLCGITAKPPHREITKTAIGAELSVDWEYAPSAVDLISDLKGKGMRIVAIEQTDQSVSLDQIEFQDDLVRVLIFGNEVDGVSDAVLSLCDEFVEIPQFGTKHSLNISVSAGVVLWHFQQYATSS
ncbi:MAG: RNA methyltransferase [Flavobacteriales bacterium]|nr:RNA methyltransferase [Flavobacteriales bacterium]